MLLRRKAGITRDWHRWTSEHIDLVVRLRAEGLTIAQIGERLGRTETQVRGRFLALDGKLR